MRLSGGGRAIDVPGGNQKVEVTLPLDRKDLSGQSSASSFANAGAKAQKVSVSTLIAMENADDLTQLAEIARACDAKDEPIVYEIDDSLSNALKIRQVIFCGEFKSSEADGVRAWQVSFQLQEYLSVAEKREQRAMEKAPKEEPAQDGETVIGSTDPATVNKVIKESTQS